MLVKLQDSFKIQEHLEIITGGAVIRKLL